MTRTVPLVSYTLYMETHEHDALLLQRFASSGDSIAFSMLVQRHGPMVLRTCNRILKNHADAHDAFQATFLVLARKAASIRGGVALPAWLHKVAIHAALRLKRSRTARTSKESEAARMLPPPSHDAPSWNSLQPALEEEIAKLPSHYRQVLTLCCLEGHTYDEAATILKTSSSSVRGTLSRARDLLREALSRRNIIIPAAALGSLLMLANQSTAAVPAPLLASTVQTAHAIRFGLAIPDASLSSSQLAKGVLHAMLLKKLSFSLAATAAVLAVAFSLSFLALSATAVDKPNPAPAEPPPIALPSGKPDFQNDPTPDGALLRLGSTRFRHHAIRDIQVSPDGKIIASSGEKEIRLFDSATGQLLRTLTGHSDIVSAIAFSPDGKTLASVSWDKSARLWDVSTGKSLRTLPQTFNAYAVAFSPDGKLLATGCNIDMKKPLNLFIYETDTGKQLHALAADSRQINALAFSPDSKKLAVGGREGVSLWDPQSGELAQQWKTDPKRSLAGVSTVAFSPDGKTLAFSALKGDPKIRLIDLASSELAPQFGTTGFGLATQRLLFIDSGKQILAIGADSIQSHSIRIFDVATGKESRKLDTLGSALAITPDASRIIDGRDSLRIRDLATGKDLTPASGHGAPLVLIAALPENRFLTASEDSSFRLWDADGKSLKVFTAESTPEKAALSPDRKLLAYGGEGSYSGGTYSSVPVRILNLETAAQLAEVNPGYHKLSGIQFSSDGKSLLTVAGEYLAGHTLRFWSVAAEPKLLREHKTKNATGAFALSPDSSRIAIANYGGAITLLNAATFETITKFTGHPNAGTNTSNLIHTLAFSPDGKLLASGAEDPAGNLRIWDASTGKQLLVAKHPRQVLALAFSPDSTLLATGSGTGLIRVFDVKTLRPLGDLLATQPPTEKSRPRISYADASSTSVINPAECVLTLSFSPDSTRLLSGSQDGLGYIWDLAPFLPTPNEKRPRP